jgi:predicted nucleotidyltransferase
LASTPPLTDFGALLRTLQNGGVQFVVIGGIAAAAHGLARNTLDVDVVYARDDDNLTRLAGALEPIHPYLRGAPPGLPFRLDAATLRRGLNFTLTTDHGALDVLGEIIGGGGYEELVSRSHVLEVVGVRCHVLDLEPLIAVKRAAGRPKDFEAIAELEALLEERDRLGDG